MPIYALKRERKRPAEGRCRNRSGACPLGVDEQLVYAACMRQRATPADTLAAEPSTEGVSILSPSTGRGRQ